MIKKVLDKVHFSVSFRSVNGLSLFLFQKDEVYLNLVLDFVPETVYRVARHFNKAKTTIPIIYVKVGKHTAWSLGERAKST